MSSKTSQILMLDVDASRKRKQCEANATKAEPAMSRFKPTQMDPMQLKLPTSLRAKNRLLAGYFAHEFLTKGTLFGEAFEPAGAEQKLGQPKPDEPAPKVYADVAYLLKLDGTHIPGIVNPAQLGRWIQKGNWSS